MGSFRKICPLSVMAIHGTFIYTIREIPSVEAEESKTADFGYTLSLRATLNAYTRAFAMPDLIGDLHVSGVGFALSFSFPKPLSRSVDSAGQLVLANDD